MSASSEPYCETSTQEQYQTMLAWMKHLVNKMTKVEAALFDLQSHLPSATTESGIEWRGYHRQVSPFQLSQVNATPQLHDIPNRLPRRRLSPPL